MSAIMPWVKYLLSIPKIVGTNSFCLILFTKIFWRLPFISAITSLINLLEILLGINGNGKIKRSVLELFDFGLMIIYKFISRKFVKIIYFFIIVILFVL